MIQSYLMFWLIFYFAFIWLPLISAANDIKPNILGPKDTSTTEGFVKSLKSEFYHSGQLVVHVYSIFDLRSTSKTACLIATHGAGTVVSKFSLVNVSNSCVYQHNFSYFAAIDRSSLLLSESQLVLLDRSRLRLHGYGSELNVGKSNIVIGDGASWSQLSHSTANIGAKSEDSFNHFIHKSSHHATSSSFKNQVILGSHSRFRLGTLSRLDVHEDSSLILMRNAELVLDQTSQLSISYESLVIIVGNATFSIINALVYFSQHSVCIVASDAILYSSRKTSSASLSYCSSSYRFPSARSESATGIECFTSLEFAFNRLNELVDNDDLSVIKLDTAKKGVLNFGTLVPSSSSYQSSCSFLSVLTLYYSIRFFMSLWL